ncbi:hypothetical protein BJ165DRAFT_1478763 [Panaeolus papilionaceus]|nr:hypothetical protein BJ165DRAFT_1478763 [Panaeolus papilionaceus]
MSPFPQEIIELILEHLYRSDDASTLRSCCLVNWSFCSAAQPRLFRRVIVDIYYDTNDHLTSPFASLYTLLTSSPHLAPFIHHFGFKVSSRWPGEAQYAPWMAEDEHLARLFPLLTHLRRFGVYPSRSQTNMQHKVKWNDLSESAQHAIDELLRRDGVESLDLMGFLVLSGGRLSRLRGVKEIALSRIYLAPTFQADEGGSSHDDEHNEEGQPLPPQSQLSTLVMGFPVRRVIPATLEWVQAAFDCTQLKDLILELPNPAGPGRMAETTLYGFIHRLGGTLRSLSVELGTIEFSRYNQLGYRITEGSSVPPDWSSLLHLQSLTLKVDAVTKFFLYDHIDWFTNPVPFIVGLVNNMTRAASSHGLSSSGSLQHFHLQVKFIRFTPRLIAGNHIAWGDLFSLLLSPSLFPNLRTLELSILGLGEAEAMILEGQVRSAMRTSASLPSSMQSGDSLNNKDSIGKRVDFHLTFVDEKIVGDLERLPRI